MEVVHQTHEKIVLRMNANLSLANALRRSVNEVPVLAIDEVELFKNDSALYDEMISHRLGLVALKNEENFNDKTEHELKLSKKGPCMVVAADLKGNISAVFPQTPIVLLEKDQELELIATVRSGRGTTHEKYSPGLCFYRNLVIVSSKNSHVHKIVENSKGLVKPEKVKEGILCDLNEASAEEIDRLDSEAMKDSDEILLFVESFGQMSAKDIMLKAIRSLGENLEAFEKALK